MVNNLTKQDYLQVLIRTEAESLQPRILSVTNKNRHGFSVRYRPAASSDLFTLEKETQQNACALSHLTRFVKRFARGGAGGVGGKFGSGGERAGFWFSCVPYP